MLSLAVTLARSLTNTFAGTRPVDVAGFVVAQIIGALLALIAASTLMSEPQLQAR